MQSSLSSLLALTSCRINLKTKRLGDCVQAMTRTHLLFTPEAMVHSLGDTGHRGFVLQPPADLDMHVIVVLVRREPSLHY